MFGSLNYSRIYKLADIKTHLRELSVGFYFYNDRTLSQITPSYFLDVCRKNIVNCVDLDLRNIASIADSFTANELQIIKNGLKLGKVIQDIFSLGKNPHVFWTGLSTQSGVSTDLIINGVRFSLKEESHILENMGLYRLMSLVTNEEKYKKGLHVFKEFAKDSFYRWFEKTRDLLLEVGPIPSHTIVGKEYKSHVHLDKDGTLSLIFHRGGVQNRSVIKDFPNCDYRRFQQATNSTTREKVFSKWLKEKVENEPEYEEAKRTCSVAAGEKILHLLRPHINTSTSSLYRLFRLEDEEYYYAKSTSDTTEIYEVPTVQDCKSILIIKDIKSIVPKHQLNIHTVIENTETHKQIEFRNELRYSHGQFNGTPEAKFYIANGDMTVVYRQVYPSTQLRFPYYEIAAN